MVLRPAALRLPRPAARFLPVLLALLTPPAAVDAARTTLVGQGTAASAWVPDGPEADADWNAISSPANIGAWTQGPLGVGYERSSGYESLIGLDVEAAMFNRSTTCYLRVSFEIADLAELAGIKALRLRMRYDDGFVAYLNGGRIAAANAPAAPDWQSAATAQHADGAAVLDADFDLGDSLGALRVGTNVLAIHGLNDGAGSSDFLILPTLEAFDAPLPFEGGVPELRFVPLASGFDRPVGMAIAGDGSGRIFVIEQRGTIRIVRDGVVQPGFFLDLRDRVRSPDNGGGNEQGLLGLAFPPGFGAAEGKKRHFYVNYTSSLAGRNGDSVVARFRLDDAAQDPDNAANPASEEELLLVDQPFGNHNGGQMNFGPDGHLYIGFGDGGSARDPGERAQNVRDLLGKMLRIDVEGTPSLGLPYGIPPDNPFAPSLSARGEIWSFGLRNPWRWSFDRQTGDLYIADVGQDAFEEVDFRPADSAGGENYGWDHYEAEMPTSFNPNPAPPITETVRPIFFYGRSAGASITGGYVYRGARFPRLFGSYLVADFVTGRVWALERNQPPASPPDWIDWELADTAFGISCFGEDEAGELYLADLGGTIHRIEDSRDAAHLQVTEAGFAPGTDRFRFTWGAAIGRTYQVQRSGDLVEWGDIGPAVTATAADNFRLTFQEPESDEVPPDHRYFRVLELE